MDVVVQISTSVVAAVLVAVAAIVWRRSAARRKRARRHRRNAQRMDSSGVTEVFFARSQYGGATNGDLVSITSYLATAKIRLRYIGLWMAQASEQYRLDEVLSKRIENGCEIHFIVLNPKMSPSRLRAVADTLGLADAEVKDRARIALEKLRLLRNELPGDLKSRLRVSVHDVPVIMTMIEFDWQTPDHKVWLDIKLRSRGRADSLSLEILPSGDGLLERVVSSFEDVVARCEDV